MILLNCEHATDRMTDLMEDALPWPKRLALRAHLVMCAGCRAFLKGLRAVPVLSREAFQEPLTAPAEGCASLDAVLSRLRAGEGSGPRFHPEPEQIAQLKAGALDLPMRLLVETHLGACAACRATNPDLAAHAPVAASNDAPPLPDSLRTRVLPPSDWVWRRHFLKGSRSARILEDHATGAKLWITFLPQGQHFPHHRHEDHEAAVLLSGWVEDGPYLQGPGDFIQHDTGTDHMPMATSADGCWCLSRSGPGGVRFSGWRRIFS